MKDDEITIKFLFYMILNFYPLKKILLYDQKLKASNQFDRKIKSAQIAWFRNWFFKFEDMMPVAYFWSLVASNQRLPTSTLVAWCSRCYKCAGWPTLVAKRRAFGVSWWYHNLLFLTSSSPNIFPDQSNKLQKCSSQISQIYRKSFTNRNWWYFTDLSYYKHSNCLGFS